MKTGTTIKNNQTGETLTMIVSDEDNGGACQLYEIRVPPRRMGPPLHYHLTFTETFTVKEGTLDFYLGPERRHILLGPQQSVTAEFGQLHTFGNERDAVTVITVESKPASGVAKAFQLAYGVANDGEASKDGLPKSLLVRLVFVRMAGGFVPGVPLVVQKIGLGLAALLARVTGVEKRLAKYFE